MLRRTSQNFHGTNRGSASFGGLTTSRTLTKNGTRFIAGGYACWLASPECVARKQCPNPSALLTRCCSSGTVASARALARGPSGWSSRSGELALEQQDQACRDPVPGEPLVR